MNKIEMDFIKSSDLVNDGVWEILWDLSGFKSEIGFDFIVDKKYILQYLSDGDNNPNMKFVYDLTESMKTDYLYIKQY